MTGNAQIDHRKYFIFFFYIDHRRSAALISAFVFAIDSTIILNFLNLKPSSVVVQPSLFRTWSESPKTVFSNPR